MAEFDKDIDPLVKVARSLGWEVSRTRNCHIRFTPPEGSPWPIIFASGTPSEGRGRKNAKAFLKQCGVEVNNDRRRTRR